MKKNDNHLNEQMKTFSEFTRQLDDAKKRAMVDALTGLGSRAKGEALLHSTLQAGYPMTVILVDLDHFKQINKQWGHECGDQLLKGISQALAEDSDTSDVVCRWGGDRFLRMSQLDQSSREGEARRLQILLSREYEVTADEKSFKIDVSVSVGLAQTEDGDSLEDVLARAEADLTRCKNRVVTDSSRLPQSH
ncbi:MAG TPA: GGDEF domain-containing protein [Terriglobia bacterium]|nr:GGDEF domain-containing protein [Terriglobia bacterium]